MTKKHRNFLIGILIFSILHLIFCTFYQRLYGYFNLHQGVQGFVTLTQILRVLFLGAIGIGGFLSLREQVKKAIPFYLAFFLFNLILPFIFR
ncbi:hypothetical protein [Enterococcus massiliensis]|uniref:hypothetical protein n=1 Tax=Enterococcus massiliensis TaxID=1640685 RepID=UPI00065DFFCC|nr:hypothetical protein [Enterococcus massiliensis]